MFTLPRSSQLEVPYEQGSGLGYVIWPQPGVHISSANYPLLFQYHRASPLILWCPIHHIWGYLGVRM